MIRDHVLPMHATRDHGFRWRGGEVTRLEGLADAVFGFAITLLVVSLEVPKTFHELLGMYGVQNFAAFATCFLLVAMIWYDHHVFFRRYGLDDLTTTVLNFVLLFVVLFYVYPLKFLATMLFGLIAGAVGLDAGPGPVGRTIQPGEITELMVLYGVGWVLVYGTFLALYGHAYRRRDALGLDEVERLETRYTMYDHAIMAGVGVLSLAVAVAAARTPYGAQGAGGLAGFAFLLIAPLQAAQGFLRGRARRQLDARLAAAHA